MASRSAAPSTALYSRAKLEACLHRKHVWFGHGTISPRERTVEKLYPAGATGYVDLLPYSPNRSLPAALLGPKIGAGAIYFFATSALARAGLSKLADVWVYGKGLGESPLAIKALGAVAGAKTPTRAELPAIERVAGNVVVLWQYPREYRASSDRLIAGCLTRSAPTASPSRSSATRTVVHLYEPFTASGRIRPSLHLYRVAASCEPSARYRLSTSLMKTYVCTLPADMSQQHPFPKGSYACSAACKDGPCWSAPHAAKATMVCLDSMPGLLIPASGWDGELISVTNHPVAASGASNPLQGEPWALRLKSGDICLANWPDLKVRRRSGHLPLLYSCGSTIARGFVHRTTPFWSIGTASGAAADANHYSQSTIAAAWFISNTSTRSS